MPAQGIQPGDVVSLFLFLDDAAVARPVWCLDNAPATNGLSVCQPLTFAPGDTPVDPSSGIAPYASWRFGNLSPDAMESAVDVCVKPTSYPSWDVGDKQAAFKDIPYKAITGNKPLSIDSDGYDVKVLPFSPNPDCSLAPADTAHVFSTGEVPPSTNTTVAVLGLNGNASTPFGVEAFPNEDDSGTADNPGVRFINVVAGETHVAKLSIPDPVAFILMSQFTNVSFGQTDLSLAANAGYKVVAVPHGSYFGLDDDADPSADYISATLPQAVTPAPNQTYTIWATGNKGDTSNPPVVLFCQDSETQTSSFLSCSTVTLNPQ